MNNNPIDFNYIDGLNTYPIQDYIDEKITTSITSNIQSNITISNISISNNQYLSDNIYYINSNLYFNNNVAFGDIVFKTSYNYPNDINSTATKIDYTGKLKVYHNYNILQPTFVEGYYDVEDELIKLMNDGILTDGQLTALEAGAIVLQGEINDTIIALNQVEGTLATLINNIYFSDTYNQFRILSQLQDFGQYQATYASTILNIQNRASTLYNSSLTNGLLVSAGIGLAGAILSAGASYFYYEKASNALISNINFTNTQKSNIHNENLSSELTTYNNLYNSVSNLSIIQGFINSNIQTQQYIRNLKCDNLNLNTGNIAGINYINVNNIVADGKIKENNKFLDSTYLTSNHLYNLTYNYSAEREYPPKAFTTSTPETTTTFLNKLVYTQTLYLDTNSITYGSGYYEIYSSSTYDTDTFKSLLFNHNISDLPNARWFINLYNFGTGLYQGDNSIDGSYYGDWIIIKLPQQIMLTKFRFYTGGALNSSPGTWKCYGSNDGLIFTEITQGSQTTTITTANYSLGYYEKSLNSSFTTQYQYFGFVVNKLVSINSFGELRFGELRLYGKEIISNTINSNIYTTSNICKNLIIYDTPQVYKRSAFYCYTDEIIYPNGGSTPYYTHHIDLRLYTKTGYTIQNDPYRIFKIKCFFETSYFQKLTNGTPDICEYSIHMSSKAAAGGEGSIAGINIMAIGTPQNYFLNNIMNTNLFILRNANNNFNYLSIVSTQNADVRVFITDELN